MKEATQRLHRLRQMSYRVWRVARALASTLRGLIIASKPGRSDRRYIFVFGISRAGTSLTASILATDKDVATFKDEIYYFLKRNYHYLTLSDVPPNALRTAMRVSRDRASLFDKLSDQVLLGKPGAKRVLEKIPGHGLVVKQILDTFPKARIVIGVREPRDAYASIRGGVALPSMTAERYARLWNELVAIESTALSDRVFTVRYEDLVTEPEKTVRALCEFLNLSFKSTILASERQAENSPSYLRRGDHDRIGKVITSKSIGQWREILSDKTAKIISDGCAGAMPRLVYGD